VAQIGLAGPDVLGHVAASWRDGASQRRPLGTVVILSASHTAIVKILTILPHMVLIVVSRWSTPPAPLAEVVVVMPVVVDGHLLRRCSSPLDGGG
jgi:hypothetical protein